MNGLEPNFVYTVRCVLDGQDRWLSGLPTLGTCAAVQHTEDELAAIQQQKSAAEKELSTLRAIADGGIDTLRKLARIPTESELRRERYVGFISGVLASLLAAFVYSGIAWLWQYSRTPNRSASRRAPERITSLLPTVTNTAVIMNVTNESAKLRRGNTNE